MSKVCVIIEQCNVLHGKYLSYSETVSVTKNRAAAESKIENLKEKIITVAAANGWIATDFTSPANGVIKVIVDGGDILRHYVREYTWSIEEHELIDEL